MDKSVTWELRATRSNEGDWRKIGNVGRIAAQSFAHASASFGRRGGGGGGGAESSSSSSSSSGTSADDMNLTYAAPTQATVTGTAANIVAVGAAATMRRITIWVPNGADTGIYVNPAGTADSTNFLIPAGGSGIWNTNQAISAIRAGSADVTAYIQVVTV